MLQWADARRCKTFAAAWQRITQGGWWFGSEQDEIGKGTMRADVSLKRGSPAERLSWFSQRGEMLLFIAILALVAALFCLGGGTPRPFQVIVYTMLGCVVAYLTVRSGGFAIFIGLPGAVRILLGGIVALPVLQLIPLPPELWRNLPGQELRAASLGLAGELGWQPLTLVPIATSYTLVMVYTFAILIVAILTLAEKWRIKLLWSLFGLILISLLAGVIQVSTAGEFPQFQSTTHLGYLIGFYANKNHMGLTLAASIPLAFYLLDRRPTPGWPGKQVFLGYWAVALVATVATSSRSGVGLAVLASALVGFRMMRGLSLRYRIALFLAVLAVAAVVMQSSMFDAVYRRFQDVGADTRWAILAQSMPLIRTYWGFGSGAGSFLELFAAHEKLEWVRSTYPNQMHNDYGQVLLEFGLPGVLLLLLGAFSIGRVAWMIATGGLLREARAQAVLGCTIVLMFALQSIVDYPLRRPATLPLFAVACALAWRRARTRSGGTKSGVASDALREMPGSVDLIGKQA